MIIVNRTSKYDAGWSALLWLAAGPALTSTVGSPAMAQQARADAVAPAEQGPALEDIVVTAQKRLQNLQDVPISIAVVSGKAITDQNYRSLQDLSRNQPAFSVTPVGRGVRLSLRGISSGTNTSFDQSVVTFIDDVYHGKARSSGSLLLDVDRIELLKGPQTTFFGNNAIAGAISVQTARPTDTFGGSARAIYGTQGEYATEAILNVPLTETLAVRAAGLLNGMNGYVTDRTGDGKLPHERNAAGRLSAQWKPTDHFTLFLKAEATRNRMRGGAGLQIVDCPPRAPFVAPGRFCPEIIASGGDTLLNYTRDQNKGQAINLSTQDYQATAALDLGSAALTAVSAFSHFTFVNIQDSDGSPQLIFGLRAPQRLNQYSQELRLASNDNQAQLSYIVGVYYQTSRFRDISELAYPFLSATINAAPPFAALRMALPFAQLIDVRQKEETLSGFASLTWRPTEALSLTAGGRISRVKKDVSQFIAYGQSADNYGHIALYSGAQEAAATALGIGGNLGAPGTRILSRSDSKFTPTVNVQYKASRTINLYASYSRGFKAGGFNGTLATGTTTDLPFSPEHVTAYEAGVRSELLDRRLLLNLTAFRSTYRDLQVSIFAAVNGTPVSVVQNAASSVSQGVELESKLAISQSFSVGTAMTFLDAHFKDFPAASPTAAQRALLVPNPGRPNLAPGTSQDLSGRPTAYAPKYAATFYATYKHSLTDTLDFEVEANLLHQSHYFTADQDDPRLAQDAYNKIDLRAAVSTSDGAWELAVIGKNITNRLIASSGIDSAALGSYFFTVERPRSVVVQVRRKF